MTAQPRDAIVEALVEALHTILDAVDYTSHACAPTEMVAAVLPSETIQIARSALAAYDAQPALVAYIGETLRDAQPARTVESRPALITDHRYLACRAGRDDNNCPLGLPTGACHHYGTCGRPASEHAGASTAKHAFVRNDTLGAGLCWHYEGGDPKARWAYCRKAEDAPEHAGEGKR